MTSCPEEIVWEFENFEKVVSWRLTLEHAGRQLSSLPLKQRELSSLPLRHAVGVFQISTDRDLKYHKMHRACVGLNSTVSIVGIVFLSSCQRIEVKKLINRSYLNNRVRLYCIRLCICICVSICIRYYTYTYGNTYANTEANTIQQCNKTSSSVFVSGSVTSFQCITFSLAFFKFVSLHIDNQHIFFSTKLFNWCVIAFYVCSFLIRNLSHIITFAFINVL